MADTAWISTLRSPKRNTRASNSLGREPAPLSERVKLKTVNSTKMDKPKHRGKQPTTSVAESPLTKLHHNTHRMLQEVRAMRRTENQAASLPLPEPKQSTSSGRHLDNTTHHDSLSISSMSLPRPTDSFEFKATRELQDTVMARLRHLRQNAENVSAPSDSDLTAGTARNQTTAREPSPTVTTDQQSNEAKYQHIVHEQSQQIDKLVRNVKELQHALATHQQEQQRAANTSPESSLETDGTVQQLATARTQLAHARERIAQLEQHQVSDTDLHQQWDSERADLEAALVQQQAQAREASRSQEELRNHLDDVMARLTTAQAAETARLSELHQSRSLNAGLRQELAQLEEDLRQARLAKAQALASLQHSGQTPESPQLQLEIRSLRSRLAHTQAALEDVQATTQQQDAVSLESRQAELIQFQGLLEAKNKQVRALQAALDESRRGTDSLQREEGTALELLTRERVQWQQEADSHQQTITRLHEQLQAQRLEVETLRKMQLSDGQVRQQLEQTLASQDGEISQVRSQSQLLTAQVVALQRQLTEAHEAAVATGTTPVDNTDQVAQLQQALVKAQTELTASKTKNQERSQHVARLTQALNEQQEATEAMLAEKSSVITSLQERLSQQPSVVALSSPTVTDRALDFPLPLADTGVQTDPDARPITPQRHETPQIEPEVPTPQQPAALVAPPTPVSHSAQCQTDEPPSTTDCSTMTDLIAEPQPQTMPSQSDRTQHLLGEIVRLQTQLAVATAQHSPEPTAPATPDEDVPAAQNGLATAVPPLASPTAVTKEVMTLTADLDREKQSHHGTQRKLQALSLTTKSTSRKLDFLQRAFAKAQQERSALQEENQTLLTRIKTANVLERSPVANPTVSHAVAVAHTQIQQLEQQLLLTRNQLMAHQQTAEQAQARTLELEEQLARATNALAVVVEDESDAMVPTPMPSPKAKSPQEARLGRTRALLRLKSQELKELEVNVRRNATRQRFALLYSGRQAAGTRAWRNHARRLERELNRLRIELERHGDLQQQCETRMRQAEELLEQEEGSSAPLETAFGSPLRVSRSNPFASPSPKRRAQAWSPPDVRVTMGAPTIDESEKPLPPLGSINGEELYHPVDATHAGVEVSPIPTTSMSSHDNSQTITSSESAVAVAEAEAAADTQRRSLSSASIEASPTVTVAETAQSARSITPEDPGTPKSGFSSFVNEVDIQPDGTVQVPAPFALDGLSQEELQMQVDGLATTLRDESITDELKEVLVHKVVALRQRLAALTDKNTATRNYATEEEIEAQPAFAGLPNQMDL
eukprot:m.6121 g.6121  ORF g.6121 m.6121 type:complete len:1290 (-) comp8234_c0_seq2:2-3871(-)